MPINQRRSRNGYSLVSALLITKGETVQRTSPEKWPAPFVSYIKGYASLMQ